jgi:hypothetical protein
MGYILLLIIGAAVLIGLFVMFVGRSRKPTGRTSPANDVTHKTPAADEPTPTASSTTNTTQASAAERRIPPA